MEILNKIAEKLPDVYFDWYARLLPGCAIVIVVLLHASKDQIEYIIEHPLAILFTAYTIGHFIQPASGFVVKKLEKRKKNESIYSAYKKKKIEDRNDKLIAKISKAHAEAVSMCSASILVLFFTIYRATSNHCIEWPLYFIALVLFLFCIERVNARNRKILDTK